MSHRLSALLKRFELRAPRAVVDRLTEVLLIQVFRCGIEPRLVDGGLMAGLADPRLRWRAWPACRARFAQLVGMPPGQYLTAWRLGLARTMLRRGLPVKQVAAEVGYVNASALGRVFSHRMGQNPTAWQACQWRDAKSRA